MTKVAVTFPDAMLATLAILRSVMPTYRFGTVVIDETPDNPMPYVMVRLDGSPSVRYPVVETATIRVSVWHKTEAEALALAQQVRGVLLAYPGGADIRSIASGAGVFPTTDPDNGLPLSSFTIAARLRPTTL